MRIQRIIDACELMQTKDQAGTLEALTKLHVEVEKDPAGWLCDWWQCVDTPSKEFKNVSNATEAMDSYWKLGRMLIRIAGDRIAQLEKDRDHYKNELEQNLTQTNQTS